MKKVFSLTFIFISFNVFSQDKTNTHPIEDLKVCNEALIRGDWMGVGFDSIWEMSDGALNRLSADTNNILAKIPISYGPFRGIATGEGFVWVPDVGKKKLYQIDPTTNKIVKTFDLPISDSEGSIAVADGAVWIAVNNESGTSRELKKIDVKTGTVSTVTTLPASVAGTTYQDGKIWLTSPSTGKIFVIDSKTGQETQAIDVGSGPRFITSGENYVWVLNQQDGRVVKIDAKTNQVVSTIEANLPGRGGDITYGEGAIWVTMPGVPVVKINKDTNIIEEKFVGQGMGDAIRTGYGSIWVSGETLHRIQKP